MASLSQDLEELPSIKFTPPYTVPPRLQTYLKFISSGYYYCEDHITYCFEHLFQEATNKFLDFIEYTDPTASTPRPHYYTRSEGVQQVTEYLAAQQAAKEPCEPHPLIPDLSDDNSTTPIAPRCPPSPPTPLNQPLPIPTPPLVMSTSTKSGL